MIVKTWNRISDLGVSELHSDKNDMIRLYNRMSILSILGLSLIVAAACYIGFSKIYITLVSFSILVYVFILLFNYLGKIDFGLYFATMATSGWFGLMYLCAGGNISFGLAMVTAITISCVVFQKRQKIRNRVVVLQLSFYLIPTFYVNLYNPIFGHIDFPFDELLVFIAGIIWMASVLYLFHKDREDLLNRLKNKNQELVDTTEELERFTYIASHDLKSPLRTIISFIGLLEHDLKRKDYTEMEGNLHFVKTGALQMNFLVQDILELSKLKNSTKEDRILLDLNRIFEKAKHNLTVDIEEKKATIKCQQLGHFLGDELELLLLFQNFIQNGIKYNDSQEPVIEISNIEAENSFSLIFKDNGIGIEEKYHDQIFKFFKRLHTSDKYQGTGLGLGLCKQIIDNYNGQIAIESELGLGTTFTIRFPMDQSSQLLKKKKPQHQAAFFALS